MVSDINKNIIEILQLYEFSMSIGKSFDFQKNCNDFIQLFLKRKNLNGALLYKFTTQGTFDLVYSIPSNFKKDLPKVSIEDIDWVNVNSLKPEIIHLENSKVAGKIIKQSPVKIGEGSVVIYKLPDYGFFDFLFKKEA